MSFIDLPYLLLIIGAMLACIWKYVIMEPAARSGATAMLLRRGLPLLSLYFGVNFMSEFIVHFVLAPVIFNHFIYASAAILGGIMLLAFYALVMPGLPVRLYAALMTGVMVYYFVSRALWLPGVIVQSDVVINYFVLIAVGSIIFALASRRLAPGTFKKRVQWMAWCQVVYHMINVVCRAIYYDRTLTKTVLHFIENVLMTSAILYYGAMFVITLLIPDREPVEKPELAYEEL